MKSKRVWLLSGLPGSGKSTWVKKQLETKGGFWASRDAVRFSMVAEDEPYFNREDEVFNEWIRQICEALSNPMIEDIYVDATHLNDRSRNKTLSRLPKENIREITNVIFTTPIKVCLERNRQRTGRAIVPDEVILNMAKSFKDARKHKTIFVNERGEEFDW